MSYFRNALLAILAVLVPVFMSVSASAQLGNSMDAHWGKMKGYASVTPAGHYAGQTRNVYTLGSFSYRQEQKSYQLASIQLPKIKAGCGGIDIFKGGFSMISGDQVVAMMRNILQNATTYAFKLAIDTVSPLIGKNMGELADFVNKHKLNNITSCETAMAAVDSLVANVHQSVGMTCQQMGADKGIFSDSIAGRMKCNEEAADVAAAGDAAEKAAAPINRNYAWDATQNHSLYSGNREMREFLMSLSGTIILSLNNGTGDGDNMAVTYVRPLSLDDGAIEKLMGGGSLKIHRCADDPCLNVNQLASPPISIGPDEAFRVRVEDMLVSIYGKVSGSNASALTEEEKTFIEETTLPIYRAIDVYAQAVPGSAQQSILSYADLIAYDMVLKFLIDNLREVIEGGNTITGGEGATLAEWRADVRKNIDYLLDLQSKTNERFASSIMFIDRISALEQQVAARLILVTQDNGGNYASGGR